MITRLAILFLSAGLVYGQTTYYVSPTGNDLNSGTTVGSPWTLARGQTNLTPDVTVVMLNGTYTTPINIPSYCGGTAGHPATLKAQNKWGAVLNNVDMGGGQSVYFNSPYLVFDGLRVCSNSVGNGFGFAAHDIVIRNCWVDHNYWQGILCSTAPNSNNIIEMNLIEYNGMVSAGDPTDIIYQGIYFGSMNNIVRNNVVRWNNNGFGIQCYTGYAGEWVNGNKIYGNLVYGHTNCAGVVVYGAIDGTGLLPGTNMVYGNTINDSMTVAYGTVYVSNNIIMPIASRPTAPLSNSGTHPATVLNDYNMSSIAFTAPGTHDVINSYRGFVNTNNGLYWLKSDSPARGAAKSTICGPVDFFGTQQFIVSDIGAFQYSPAFSLDGRILDPSPSSGADYWVMLSTDPVPLDRRPATANGTWTDIIGVSGGIPNVTDIATTITASGGDQTVQINNAIAAAKSNQVVVLGPGTFNVGSQIVMHKNGVVLRGSVNANGGPATVLNGTTFEAILMGDNSFTVGNLAPGHWNTVNVISGFNRGSSNIVLSAPIPGGEPGNLLYLSAPKTYPYINGSCFSIFNNTDPFLYIVKITATNGTTTTFWPPINATYLASLKANTPIGSTTYHRMGVENLIMTNGAERFIKPIGTDECWIKNVKCWGVGDGQYVLYPVLNNRLQIDHSELGGVTAAGSSSYCILNTDNTGLWLNDCYLHQAPNMVPNLLCQNNVFSYNYITNCPYRDTATHLSQIMYDHGGHCAFNLWEGNIYPKTDCDGTNSNCADPTTTYAETFFRNRVVGWDGANTDGNDNECLRVSGGSPAGCGGANINGGNFYTTLVGNVLGQAGITLTIGWVANNQGHVYSMDDGTFNIITNNWNQVTLGVQSSETMKAGWAMANSYVFASKPATFGILAWPPIDPTSSSYSKSITNIPAGYRAVFGVDPPANPVSGPPNMTFINSMVVTNLVVGDMSPQITNWLYMISSMTNVILSQQVGKTVANWVYGNASGRLGTAWSANMDMSGYCLQGALGSANTFDCSLISPGHCVFAAHTGIAPGTVLVFQGVDGLAYTNSVASTVTMGTEDVGIITLFSNVPAVVHPFEILPTNWWNYASVGSTNRYVWPVFWINNATGNHGDITSIAICNGTYTGEINFEPDVPSQPAWVTGSTFYEAVPFIGNPKSSAGCFAVLETNHVAILTSLYLSDVSGPCYSDPGTFNWISSHIGTDQLTVSSLNPYLTR